MENSSLRVTGCIREAGGLGGISYKKNENVKSPAIQYIQSSSALMLPASSGHLHLYSTISDSLMYTVIISCIKRPWLRSIMPYRYIKFMIMFSDGRHKHEHRPPRKG